jgi:hypothetical protein
MLSFSYSARVTGVTHDNLPRTYENVNSERRLLRLRLGMEAINLYGTNQREGKLLPQTASVGFCDTGHEAGSQ